MAEGTTISKCSCSSCGVNLEFPPELANTIIQCPKCLQDTLLSETGEPLAEIEAPPTITAQMLADAFAGKARKEGTSFFYTIGMLLVAITLVILPLVYLALIAVAGAAVVWWAKAGLFLLTIRGGGFYGMLLKGVLYIAPLFAGSTVVFFMIKPFLARMPRQAQPLAINPGSEQLLFSFVTQICKAVGAPFPARIDVSCEMNASASFRRGFRSMFGSDLVLTLGMPLIACTNVTQLAGIIAHEFGHFTQGFAMRLYYTINRVNGWFVRVIYMRDEWDLRLEAWAEEAEDWKATIIVATAQLSVWFSRLVLKILFYAASLISSFVSRQMEYDADKFEMELAGSAQFEESTVRLATLGVVTKVGFDNLNQIWHSQHVLPDNLPKFFSVLDQRMPEETRTTIANRVGLSQSGFFSTHPSDGERIKAARRANRPGVFAFDAPAAQLFANFDVLSKQVTYLHYEDTLNIPTPLIKLHQTEKFFQSSDDSTNQEEVTPNLAKEELEKMLGPSKLRLKVNA